MNILGYASKKKRDKELFEERMPEKRGAQNGKGECYVVQTKSWKQVCFGLLYIGWKCSFYLFSTLHSCGPIKGIKDRCTKTKAAHLEEELS